MENPEYANYDSGRSYEEDAFEDDDELKVPHNPPLTKSEIHQMEYLKKLQAKNRERIQVAEREEVRSQAKRDRIKSKALGENFNVTSRLFVAKKSTSNNYDARDANFVEESKADKLTALVQRAKMEGPDRKHTDFIQNLVTKKKEMESEKEKLKLRELKRRHLLAEKVLAMKHCKNDTSEEKELTEKLIPEEIEEPKNQTNNVPAAYQRHLDKLEDTNKNVKPNSDRIADKLSWLKKHGYSPDTKVFLCSKGYPAIRDELVRRGWVENQDKNSNIWDFIVTMKLEVLRNCDLGDDQIVNRYLGTGEFCSKAGLSKNIKNVATFEPMEHKTFFPRCYSFFGNGGEELEEFLIDFKVNAAERLLKILALKTYEQVSEIAMKIAARVCKKFVSRFSDEYVDAPMGFEPPIVSDVEWAIIQNTSDDLCIRPEFLNRLMVDFDAVSFPSNMFSLMEIPFNSHDDSKESKTRASFSNFQLRQLKDMKYSFHPSVPDIDLLDKCADTLKRLNLNRGDQGRLNGDPGDNVWIVKPAGKSRGRDIQCFGDLKKLLKYTGQSNHEVVPWVVQKYMENSLIVHKRKFDIRQWVIVTNWNPLTIYFYNDCYLRFCVNEYSLDDLDDKFVHLANNSVSKLSENFHGGPIDENMWTRDQFISYLDSIGHSGKAKWFNDIKLGMQDIVKGSFASVQDYVHYGPGNSFARGNSFEIFGFDFMLDDQLNPWLIEINSAPSMECSTKITSKLVKEALKSSVACILDAKYDVACDGTRKIRSKPLEAGVDTGEWELMYVSPYEFKPKGSETAQDLTLCGGAIAKPPTRRVVRSKMTENPSATRKYSVSNTSGLEKDIKQEEHMINSVSGLDLKPHVLKTELGQFENSISKEGKSSISKTQFDTDKTMVPRRTLRQPFVRKLPERISVAKLSTFSFEI